MTPRSKEVLQEIVEAYIANGEPVASRAIARRWHESLSAASIRNVMADLDEEGYLSQPHTSAGRVPTAKAFRLYADSLTIRRMASVEIERLKSEFGRLDTMEARMGATSRLLMELTHGVGIAAAIPGSPALDSIELVALPDKRVLMVVMTQDRQVRNRIVSLDEPVSADELITIRNYINRNFSGWRLEEVRRELSARLEHAEATYDEILQKLTLLYSKGLLDVGSEPEVHTDGVSNLVGIDLQLTREKMRELFRALEEKKRVVELLDRFLEKAAGEVMVQVGLGDAHPAMRHLSLIGLPMAMPGGTHGYLAVLGPMRMNYGRVMSAVHHIGHLLLEP